MKIKVKSSFYDMLDTNIEYDVVRIDETKCGRRYIVYYKGFNISVHQREVIPVFKNKSHKRWRKIYKAKGYEKWHRSKHGIKYYKRKDEPFKLAYSWKKLYNGKYYSKNSIMMDSLARLEGRR